MEKYFELPRINPQYVRSKDYFFLFETSRCSRQDFMSYIFSDPVEVIVASAPQDIEEAFARLQRRCERFYLCGWIAYELGYIFERASFSHSGVSGKPLVCFCVFKDALSFDHRNGEVCANTKGLFSRSSRRADFSVRRLRFDIGEEDYRRKVSRIKDYIRKGDAYQVNFTSRFNFRFAGQPLALYESLRASQSVAFGAFCKLKDSYVISLSPELFFRIEGNRIYSRPMKGTISRGPSCELDAIQAKKLFSSAKDRAENLMITDLVRNDLGRICRTGSVKTENLFDIEKYNTVFQMTSTVKGKLKSSVSYYDIFKNIFPGGSVTGAPKIRSMQIIRELERGRRGIYCGALGMIFPGKKAVFNLPIRTLVLSKGRGHMGAGSGVVIDSRAEDEFRECLLKGRFLSHRCKEFDLIETMLWDREYRLLALHLRRLASSAAYFGFNFDRGYILSRLRNAEAGFSRARKHRVRLILDRSGRVEITASAIGVQDPAPAKKAAVSRHRTDPQDPFLYHKTTNRLLYEREHAVYKKKGFYDAVFLNKRNEFTEGAISNIIVEIGGNLYTPPVSCGCLPGVFRQHLLSQGKLKERIIKPQDLNKADRVFLANSVRGLVEVKIDVHPYRPLRDKTKRSRRLP